jgi:hypothetical protein
MSDFPAGFAADNVKARRLDILRLLEASGGAWSEENLRTGLWGRGYRGPTLPIGCESDDLGHLAEAKLVRRSRTDDGVWIAEITDYGKAFLRGEFGPVAGVRYPV